MTQQTESMNNTESLTDKSIEKNEQAKIIQDLIEAEEQITKIDKATSKNKKEIKQIEDSNTWIYSKPLRKSAKALRKVTKKEREIQQEQIIAELEKELATTNRELFQAKQKLQEMELEQLPLHEDQIGRFLREKRDNGELMEFLHYAVQHKTQLQTNYATALKYIARLYMNENEDYRNWVYQKVFSALTNEEIPEFMVRAGIGENTLSLQHVASFRGSLNQRMRKLQWQGMLPEWQLDDKKLAYQFVKSLGIRTPWVSDEVYSLETLPIKEGVVIKPVDGAGSRGVYVVHSIDNIVDLKRGKQLNSWDELLEQMHKDLITHWVEKDEWMLEELILEDPEKHIPARDVKFYTFYGKVGVILEITRFPEPRYCWWNASGERIHVGKYEEQVFKGKGVSQEELSMVNELSKKIPTPFVRIDFLRAHDGLVFGEFTPKPGNYDEFDKNTDQILGDYFLRAESQLTNDLLAGKVFHEFNQMRNFAQQQ